MVLTAVKRKINELSLGNRKKVSIICAMQHRPKLFLFDEPTSGLDPLMQNVFFELIQEYVDDIWKLQPIKVEVDPSSFE